MACSRISALLLAVAIMLGLTRAGFAEPRELPAVAEESARYKETLAARDALKARVEVGRGQLERRPQQGLGAAPGIDRLAEIDQELESLGLVWKPDRRPGEDSLPKIRQLLDERAKIATSPIEKERGALHETALELERTNRLLEGLKNDLDAIRGVRAGSRATPTTLAELKAKPESFAGKFLRLTDVTFVASEKAQKSPFDGQVLERNGKMRPAEQGNAAEGVWHRLTFIEADGTRSGDSYEQSIAIPDRGKIAAGQTADLYGFWMQAGAPAQWMFVCMKMLPHGTWSGPPAPGFAPEPGAGENPRKATPAPDSKPVEK